MRIECIAYTDKGLETGQTIADRLIVEGHAVGLVRSGRDGVSCESWTARHFGEADALVYIGATGIAVRSIAPHIKSKLTDPAVLVIDAAGDFVIPLLSGHVGGANRLSRHIAGLIGAQPVITTGTDRLGHFAVDEWAAMQGLVIANPRAIVTVSAKLLRDEPATLRSDLPIAGDRPPDLIPGGDAPDICITCGADVPAGTLHLVPPMLTLGIGCRRGTPAETIETAFLAFVAALGLHPAAVGRAASIDLKAGEPGLVAFCEVRNLPFETYPADVLAAAEGEFTPSGFVQGVTGVDNVCERSAVIGGGDLIVKKTVVGGITLALSRRDYPLTFEEQPL